MVLSLAAAAVAALITPLRPQLCGASAPTPPAPHYPLRRGPWVVTMCYSETQRVQVAVPEGLVEGDTLRIAFNGQEYLVEVPRGCAAGMEFEVDVPAAPAAAPTSQDVPDAACTDAAAELMSPPPPSLSLPPPPVGAAGLEEVWLTPRRDDRPLGECIRGGEVVVCVPDVASPPELAALFSAGLAACDGRGRSQNAAVGRNRFAVSDPTAFTRDVVLGCEEILLRVLDRIDEELPSVYETLFEPSDGWLGRQPLTVTVPLTESPPPHLAETCPGLRELYMAGELEWSEGEPAINVYTEKGRFSPHTDHMALTVLIPLTAPTDDFTGGGTGFWARDKVLSDKALSDLMDEYGDALKSETVPEGAPTAVLTPKPGTALVFGGDVTHAGMPVKTGTRSVFVASFSTRTRASPAERTRGLQYAPGGWSDAFLGG